MNNRIASLAVVIATASLVPLAAHAEETYAGYGDEPTQSGHLGEKEYSPYLDIGYPQRVFWGDTHVHTSFSTDAGMVGNRLGPEEAYQFARGETVVASTGVRARLQRPLDFLVVADHAENLGLAPMIAEKNPDLLKTDFGRKISELVYAGNYGDAYSLWGEGMQAGKDPLKGNDALTRTMWERLTAAAEEFNEPGKFTALIGFEWTSSPGGNNLHRNVIFRDGKDEADRVIPMSNYDSTDPEDLWKWMAAYEEKTGGQRAGDPAQRQPLQRADVRRRDPDRRKDARPGLCRAPHALGTGLRGHPDEGRRRGPSGAVAQRRVRRLRHLGQGQLRPRAQDAGHAAARVRARGPEARLAYEETLGANPFKFGMIGSTDTHTSLSTTEENNFFGKATPGEPSADAGPLRGDDHRLLPGNPAAPTSPSATSRRLAAGLAGGVGDRKHPRGALGRHEAQGGLRHHRHAHARAGLRRLGFSTRPTSTAPRLRRAATQGRADGWRPPNAAGRQGARA